jgi:hypothetical protein
VKVQASVLSRPSHWKDAESDPETERLVARIYQESRTGLSYLEQGVPTAIPIAILVVFRDFGMGEWQRL